MYTQKELTEKYFKNHQKPFYYGDYLKIFNTNKNEEPVLDVGCGIGWLADYFVNYTGFEYSKKAVTFARDKNRNVVHGDAGKIFAFVPDVQKWAWDDYSHKRPFSKKSLSKIFIDNGFSINKISYEPVMRGVNKICKMLKINKRPYFLWLLARLPFFRRNVYIIAEKV